MRSQEKRPLVLADSTGVNVASNETDCSELLDDAEGSDFGIVGNKPLLVKSGDYELSFDHHRTHFLFGRAAKVAAYFRVITPGGHCGDILPRWYNVKTLKSPPRKGGKFDVGWHGDLVREYVRVFGPPGRQDRLSLMRFKTIVVIGRVRTVTTDSKGRSIPEPLRYSVISEITGRAT